MSAAPVIAYYITPHGYGHCVRSCDILRALRAAAPQARLHVVTTVPKDFLRARLAGLKFIPHARALDVGLVQRDSIRPDFPASLKRLAELYAAADQLRAREITFLRRARVNLVVSDIAALPLEAAAAVGVPRVAVGNFGWDFIYAAYAAQDARWTRYSRWFGAGYRQADALLRLPFAEPMRAFRHIEDLPLVAEPARPRRAELAAHTGADPRQRWVLLSFADLPWSAAALRRAAATPNTQFFTVAPLRYAHPRFHCLGHAPFTFGEILASVDAVISKPGFGLVSDCVVQRKPLAYVERLDFREYPYLRRGIQRYLPNVHLPQRDLYAGRLAAALEALAGAPRPRRRAPTGGAALAAQRLLARAAAG